MTDTWKAEYRKLVADHNALVKEYEQLRAAVAKQLSLPSVGKGNEPKTLIFLRRDDLGALEKAYRKACDYS